MQLRPNRFTHASVLVLIAILCSHVAWADVTGSMSGIVRDSSQAIVVGAKVVATNVETNFTKETIVATDGQYRLLAMPVGRYKITASAPGFQDFVATDIDL